MSLIVTHTLTHKHTCMTGEVSGLLLRYSCALSKNSFSYFLLPESSLFVQKTQDPKKKRKPWRPEDCTDSHVGYSASKWCTRRSFLHPKETQEEISHRPQREKQSTGTTSQLLPGLFGRRMIGVQRGWAVLSFTGETVPDISGILSFWSSL